MARFDIECTNCNAKYVLFEKPNFQFMKCKSCEEPINLEEFLKGVDEFNMKKVYIAGKINGESNFKAKFKAVEEELTEQGYAILNPAELPSGLHYEDYMDICFVMLDVADTIYLLHDYKDSPGALRELERAKRKGKEIVYQQINKAKITYHRLKILPRYFKEILDELKTFEVRKKDRDFKIGDELILREWTPRENYTGNILSRRISYILDDSAYCKEGYVILGLEQN